MRLVFGFKSHRLHDNRKASKYLAFRFFLGFMRLSGVSIKKLLYRQIKNSPIFRKNFAHEIAHEKKSGNPRRSPPVLFRLKITTFLFLVHELD